MSDGGKGSAPRPYSVDQNTFASNWDAIFGKKSVKKEDTNDTSVEEHNADHSELIPDSGDSKLD